MNWNKLKLYIEINDSNEIKLTFEELSNLLDDFNYSMFNQLSTFIYEEGYSFFPDIDKQIIYIYKNKK